MEVQIKRLPKTDSSICLLPRHVFVGLNLSREVRYNIHAGQITRPYLVNVNEENSNNMLIPSSAFEKLLLKEGLTLNIRAEGEDIYLGPVVGIFINYTRLPDFQDGSEAKYDGIAALEEHCLCYYFSINDILWDENKVFGYTLSPQLENRESGWFPLPDVIYDRGVHFEIEEKPLVKEIRSRFKSNPKINFINTCDYLGKWEIYKKLSEYPEMRPYLPRTIKYENFNGVLMMLKQHGFIFLKSYYGSGGKQVISIEKEREGFSVVFYSSGLKNIILYDVDDLRNKIEDFIQGKKFIIQEGIRLFKYDKRVVDLRVMIMKDAKGKWKMVENYARIAKKNFTITNICSGGERKFYWDIYPSLKSSYYPIKIPECEEVGEVTLRIAEYLEKAFGRLGDIGMDIAIDVNGKMWLIEANTKQDREVGERLNDMESIPTQSLALFEYSKYLSGF